MDIKRQADWWAEINQISEKIDDLIAYAYTWQEIPLDLLDEIRYDLELISEKYCHRVTVMTKEEFIVRKNDVPDGETLDILNRIAQGQEKLWACAGAYSLGVMHGKQAERARRRTQKPNFRVMFGAKGE